MTETEARTLIADKLVTTVSQLKVARGRLLTDAGALLEAICIVRATEQAAHAETCREWKSQVDAHAVTIQLLEETIRDLRRQLANAELRSSFMVCSNGHRQKTVGCVSCVLLFSGEEA